EVVHGHHLPPSLQTAEASGTVTRVALRDAVGAYEKDLIQDALKTTRGNRAKAARLLDTTERIINYKVRIYGIDASRCREPGASGRRLRRAGFRYNDAPWPDTSSHRRRSSCCWDFPGARPRRRSSRSARSSSAAAPVTPSRPMAARRTAS